MAPNCSAVLCLLKKMLLRDSKKKKKWTNRRDLTLPLHLLAGGASHATHCSIGDLIISVMLLQTAADSRAGRNNAPSNSVNIKGI